MLSPLGTAQMARKPPALKPHQDRPGEDTNKARRTQIRQAEVPSFSLQQAIRVPRAIADHFGHRPTRPLQVAKAMELAPDSGNFRMLCGAAVAYGLTEGGAFAKEIGISPLGMRVVRPTADNDDVAAKREALLKPRVVGQLLKRYDGSPLPREDIGMNVLQEMGVPQKRSKAVLSLIIEGAESVDLLVENKGKRYVDLHGAAPDRVEVSGDAATRDLDAIDLDPDDGRHAQSTSRDLAFPATASAEADQALRRRVFITHGKNRDLLEPIKKLLGFGEMEAVISVDTTSVAQPVPDKVLNLMRTCGAAIIHVDAERELFDPKTNQPEVRVNDNVLIEIGAAMALYGRRFILLVREGATLPSNLQGLFEVRYGGETLDMAATIKLMEAINDIKNHPLPSRSSTESSGQRSK